MNLLSLLFDFAPWIGGAVLTLLAFLGIKGVKRQGKLEERADTIKDTLKRDKEGRDAVAKEKAETTGVSARDIVDRVRSRDGDWSGL